MSVVPGVHRVSRASTNLYILEENGSVMVIDAGLPAMWDETCQVLQRLGRSWDDVAAIVLTHGHFDHVGLAARAVAEHDLPVWVHPGDRYIVRHPYRYRPGRSRLAYPTLHPRSIPHLAGMVAAGAWHVHGIDADLALIDGEELDLPGQPVVISTPGHTDGHCALHVRSRDVIFTGDALVTLDPYTGRVGPRIVSRGGTHDAAAAKASLALIGATDAAFVAPGHGDVWTHGASEAVAIAERRSVP